MDENLVMKEFGSVKKTGHQTLRDGHQTATGRSTEGFSKMDQKITWKNIQNIKEKKTPK